MDDMMLIGVVPLEELPTNITIECNILEDEPTKLFKWGFIDEVEV